MADNPQPDSALVERCLDAYRSSRHQINVFGGSVLEFITTHPKLTGGRLPIVHSVRYRVKDEEHLREKIIRKKVQENRDITPENLFTEVTDLAGVRVLHLYTGQFSEIHAAIEKQWKDGHWAAHETPMAYTWDPESQQFFESLGLATSIKESHYTSVHYVVKPNHALPITCEIQVRTLFEEAWGEIDHVLNYPQSTESIACREQIRVLAKVVGAGTRLADAIFRSHTEFQEDRNGA
jgi:putative GTP pyrophosphokinase